MVVPYFSETIRAGERSHTDAPVSFDALLRQYQRPLYGFIYRMMGNNADDAADLTQETFIKVYRALDRVPPDANVAAWLYRIARNCCLDELRRRKRAHWLIWDGAHGTPLVAPTVGIDPEAAAIRREGDGAVMAALARMSHRNRAALVLRECEGMSCEEIGAVFGISRKAVKSMLFRARDEFRRITLALPTEGEVPSGGSPAAA